MPVLQKWTGSVGGRTASALMPPPENSEMFPLAVLVEHEIVVVPFPVHSTTTVSGLKEILLRELDSLKGIGLDSYTLYLVDIDLSSYIHNLNSLRGLNAEDGVRMAEFLPIWEYWKVPPPRSHLQVIVKVEHKRSGSKRDQPDTQTDDSDLSEVQEKQAKRYRLGSNPSEVCKDAKSMEAQQRSAEILSGRPWTSAGPPVGLYHPVFDQFCGYMQESTPTYRTGSSTSDQESISVDVAFEFMRASSEFYVTQQSRGVYDRRLIGRVEAILPILNSLLGVNLVRVKNSDLTEPDGRATTRTPSGDDGISTIAEYKLEPGIGGDPKTQAQQSYARACSLPEYNSIRRRSCCPCFLIAIEGPWITVMGAVYLQKVVIEHLAGPIFLPPLRLHNPCMIDTALRLFYALRRSLRRLDEYYSCLPILEAMPDARFFPCIQSYGTGTQLAYTSPLSDMSKAVYLANVGSTKVVVKFASKYNVAAHQLLANNNIAPKLLYDGTNARRYGGLIMLVMEHVEGETLDQYLQSPSPSQEQLTAVLESVTAAVHLLHGHDLVFGDLRTPNILIGNDGRVRIIDFDWCGRHGIDKYPFIIGNGVEWAVGVGPLSTMDKVHDLHMLKNLVLRIQAGEVPGTW